MSPQGPFLGDGTPARRRRLTPRPGDGGRTNAAGSSLQGTRPARAVALALGLLALGPGAAGASYSTAELCRPGFELERLARSDMKRIVAEVSGEDEGRTGALLRRVLERWGALGYYGKARAATAEAAPEIGQDEIDAAVREALRRACQRLAG